MRNILKKAAAALLAIAMCLSFAGCYSENNTWAAKLGDDTLPIGSYIYYLNSAYSEAMAKVDGDTEVLKATVEGKDAQSWIRDRALQYLNAYYYVNGKFNELGLELTEEDMDSVNANTDTLWTYYGYKDVMEDLGIAKSSFTQAFSLYNSKYQKLLQAMYGEDGEFAVPEEELQTYYTENYSSYEYFYASLTTTDEEGNSVEMTDEEKADTKKKLDALLKRVSSGEITLETAAGDYAAEATGSADNSTYQFSNSVKTGNISSTLIREALENAKEEDFLLLENDSTSVTGYYVIHKASITEKFEEVKEDETQRASLLNEMKSDEFFDFVMDQKLENVTINQNALNRIALSKLVNDNNKKGTSSAPSEESEEEAE